MLGLMCVNFVLSYSLNARGPRTEFIYIFSIWSLDQWFWVCFKKDLRMEFHAFSYDIMFHCLSYENEFRSARLMYLWGFLYYNPVLLVVSLFHHLLLSCRAVATYKKEEKLIVWQLYLCIYINLMVLLITVLDDLVWVVNLWVFLQWSVNYAKRVFYLTKRYKGYVFRLLSLHFTFLNSILDLESIVSRGNIYVVLTWEVNRQWGESSNDSILYLMPFFLQ
jgi:hypothetical protein